MADNGQDMRVKEINREEISRNEEVRPHEILKKVLGEKVDRNRQITNAELGIAEDTDEEWHP